MKRIVSAGICLALILLASCLIRITGSGIVASEDRDVKDFDRIKLSGTGVVRYDQAQKESLTITAEENLFKYIGSENKGKSLELTVGKGGVSVAPTKELYFDVKSPELKAFSISGSASFEAASLEAPEISFETSGSGKIRVDSFKGGVLNMSFSGSGSGIIRGKVDVLNVNISGSGSFEGKDLEASEVNITISGSGKTVVRAADKLNIKISGSGDVFYYGSPEITQDISGSGKVKALK